MTITQDIVKGMFECLPFFLIGFLWGKDVQLNFYWISIIIIVLLLCIAIVHCFELLLEQKRGLQ